MIFMLFIHWERSKVDPDLTYWTKWYLIPTKNGSSETCSILKRSISKYVSRNFAQKHFQSKISHFLVTAISEITICFSHWISLTKNLHFISRCAASSDDSVVILENGQGNNARFKFNMFKWRSKTSYIYMHCEVHLCDKEKETCSNDDVSTRWSLRIMTSRDLNPV